MVESIDDREAEPRMRELFGCHDKSEAAEVSLVLAAVAALNGISFNGEPMRGEAMGDRNEIHLQWTPRAPTLRGLVRETGLPLSAVRRGVRYLSDRGEIVRTEDGYLVYTERLALRHDRLRQAGRADCIRLLKDDRMRGFPAHVLLLLGFVRAQVDKRGRLPLGLELLRQRLGDPKRPDGAMARRTLQSAIKTLDEAGLIRRWTAPVGRGQLILSIVAKPDRLDPPSPSGAPTSPSGAPTSRSGAGTSPSGARTSGVHPELHPDLHKDARSRVVPDHGEAAAASAAPPPADPGIGRGMQSPGPVVRSARLTVEGWVRAFVDKGIDRLESRHVAELAGLLDQLAPDRDKSDRRAFAAERRKLATRVIRWCSSPRVIGTRLLEAVAKVGAERVPSYLASVVEADAADGDRGISG